VFIRKTLINCLCGRIAALRGARNIDIFLYIPRFLRSVRLALHPAQTINQHFLRGSVYGNADLWSSHESNKHKQKQKTYLFMDRFIFCRSPFVD